MSLLASRAMRNSRFGSLLLALGAIVGAAAGIGLIFGFKPASLPPALLNIAAYKLTFVGAFGLLAAGAVMIRYGRREEMRDTPESRNERTRAELPEGESSLFTTDDDTRPSPASSPVTRKRHE
jgi:hypothetical protein